MAEAHAHPALIVMIAVRFPYAFAPYQALDQRDGFGEQAHGRGGIR